MPGKSAGRNYIYLLVLVLLNVMIYIPVILKIPGYIMDDYHLFTVISSNQYNPFDITKYSQFFLSLRPVTYLSLWLDFNLFGDNSIAIKLSGLILHTFLVISIYFLFNLLTQFLKINISKTTITVLCIIFSIHLDSLTWIYWISNRTESLMLLFYVWSAICFLLYFKNEKKYLLFFSFLFYILSILSKQSSLHLPFLLLIGSIYQMRQKGNSEFKLYLFYVFLIFILILFSSLNYFIYSDYQNLLGNLWKKPFSFFGILLHLIFPLFSGNIYNYFLLNKEIAAFIFIPASILLFVFVVIRKNLRKKFILLLIITVIIIYPRIFATGGSRLNGILLLWLLVLLMYLFSKMKSVRMICLVTGLLILSYSISFLIRTQSLETIFVHEKKNFGELVDLIQSCSGQNFILCSDSNDIIPYKYYYYIHSSVGLVNSIITSPVFYELVLVNHDLSLFNKKIIDCRKKGDYYEITSYDPLIYLLINPYNPDFVRYRIIEKESSRSGRGFSRILLDIPQIIEKDTDQVLYFDGLKWKELK
ncbi:MAG TPA: hypothetical protein PLZ15_07510 [Melioribacteraceae bacterium]|nr:hypothetical protein [Melioribacteraceae bacterium]